MHRTLKIVAATGSGTVAAAAFSPLDLFGVGDTGFLYDFSNLTTLFQDAAGTTPVTANDDVIGLVTDTATTEDASQATTANKPLYKTGGFASFDGVNDQLVGAYQPQADMTIAARFVSTTGGSTDKLIGGGASTGNLRCYLSVNAAGNIGGGVGTQSDTTIKGTSSITNVTGVGVLTFDGSTVKLYWQGVEEYSAAQSGDPDASAAALYIGCWNNNGTQSDFFVGNFYDALVINRVLTPTEVSNLTTYWNA